MYLIELEQKIATVEFIPLKVLEIIQIVNSDVPIWQCIFFIVINVFCRVGRGDYNSTEGRRSAGERHSELHLSTVQAKPY